MLSHSLLLPGLVTIIFARAAHAGGDGKQDVCHRGLVINVSASAVSAHIAHGDTLPAQYNLDGDGDGFGGAGVYTAACEAPAGYVDNADDCDDTRSDVAPGASELCNGLDDDCDGDADEGAAGTIWYVDLDADGWGDELDALESCEQPYGYVADAGDCDDEDPDVNPAAAETCSAADDDCDGVANEAGALDETSWFADLDEDGYGDPADELLGCEAPWGYVADASDCDDGDPTVNPAATELCNEVDDDCDGGVDLDAADQSSWYIDLDGDGFGDPGLSELACAVPDGFTANATDCDDASAEVYPGADETCNEIDDDCSGTVDDAYAIDALVWYADEDADGYGATDKATACAQPEGYVAATGDCDDTDDAVFPDAIESCNDADDDCDGTPDDGVIADLWYADDDGDGFGVGTDTVESCDPYPGYVAVAGDCNDGSASVHPGATELMNGKDDDCDNAWDEGLGLVEASFGGVTHAYFLNSSALSWRAARDACAAKGYQLVKLETTAESDWLARFAVGTNLWIGANDLDMNGQMTWMDGAPVRVWDANSLYSVALYGPTWPTNGNYAVTGAPLRPYVAIYRIDTVLGPYWNFVADSPTGPAFRSVCEAG